MPKAKGKKAKKPADEDDEWEDEDGDENNAGKEEDEWEDESEEEEKPKKKGKKLNGGMLNDDDREFGSEDDTTGAGFGMVGGAIIGLGVGLALKLAVLPAAVFALMALRHDATTAASVGVLETAMPPMITAGALAISHRLAPSLAAALVGYGTVLSLVTLPLWAAMLR